MKPSSYAIVSCVHGRSAITEAWARHLATHFSGPVVVAGDDPELRACMEKHLGGSLIWVPYYNFPLAAKWNRAAERAIDVCAHLVILGSDDFPSPELFNIWEHITKLRYKWARIASCYFYSMKFRELSQLKSQFGFGTGRMFPSTSFRHLFETEGYAWTPSLNSKLDASLYHNMSHPVDDIVLTQNDSCWILAVKSDQQIHTYEKIRQAYPDMPTIEQRPAQVDALITWLRNQPGMKPTRLPSGKLKQPERG